MTSSHITVAGPKLAEKQQTSIPTRLATTARTIGRLIWLAGVLTSLSCMAMAQATAGAQGEALPVDKTVKSLGKADQTHHYPVKLGAGEFFQVRVDERGLQVSIKLRDAAGTELASMSSPNEADGVEVLSFITAVAGDYTLDVHIISENGPAPEYTIWRLAPRVPTAGDRRRIDVERLFAEGMIARDAAGQAQTAIRKFSEAVAGWEELADSYMAAVTRRLVAESRGRALFVEAKRLYGLPDASSKRMALEKFQEAAPFYHEAGRLDVESVAYFGAAVTAEEVKEYRLERDLFKKVLPLFTRPEQTELRVTILDKIAKLSLLTGDKVAAIEYFTLTLPLYKDPETLARTASDIGGIYYQLGNFEKALEFLQRALNQRRQLSNSCNISATLTNMGAVERERGERGKALDLLLKQSLPLHGKPTPCSIGERYATKSNCPETLAATLINIGEVYYDLGDYKAAQCFLEKAFQVTRSEEYQAIILYDLGTVEYATGRYDEAQAKFLDAESRYQKIQTAAALIDTQLERAKELKLNAGSSDPFGLKLDLESLVTAMRTQQALGVPNSEAKLLNSLGLLYNRLGKSKEALEKLNRAILLFRSAGDLSGEATASANAMIAWRALGNRRMAIFFGKLSIMKFQQLRADARGAGAESERTYLGSVRSSYQHLAELLIEEGSFPLAIQVLSLYQDQHSFDAGFNADKDIQSVGFSKHEQRFLTKYDVQREEQRKLEEQIQELLLQVNGPEATPAQVQILTTLQLTLKGVAGTFANITEEAAREFTLPASNDDKVEPAKNIVRLIKAQQDIASTIASRAVTLYTLVGDHKLYVLAISNDGIKMFSRDIEATELNTRAGEFVDALHCADLNPYVVGGQLYDAIFRSSRSGESHETLEAALERDKPQALLWSLDGPLRYLPIAALYDETKKEFVVQKYQTAVFTGTNPQTFTGKPQALSKGIGLGTSKQFTGLDPLPGTEEFLTRIFGNPARTGGGLLSGKTVLNSRFTIESLEALDGEWPLVHIASHFVFLRGDSQKSYLKMGQGNDLTLAALREKRGLFRRVELLAVPICDSAEQRPDAYGKEIDSFADLAQRLGANSVIASLWQVSYEVTPKLMTRFYQLARTHPDWPKAELLRQAQLSVLRGEIKVASPTQRGVGAQKLTRGSCPTDGRFRQTFVSDPKAPLAHPYYWSSFVLYGGAR